jgi:hypothetical protein
VDGPVSNHPKRIAWIDLVAVFLLVAAIVGFVLCWIRTGDVHDGGPPGSNNITGYLILLFSSAAVVVATVSFLVIRRNRVGTTTDDD